MLALSWSSWPGLVGARGVGEGLGSGLGVGLGSGLLQEAFRG